MKKIYLPWPRIFPLVGWRREFFWVYRCSQENIWSEICHNAHQLWHSNFLSLFASDMIASPGSNSSSPDEPLDPIKWLIDIPHWFAVTLLTFCLTTLVRVGLPSFQPPIPAADSPRWQSASVCPGLNCSQLCNSVQLWFIAERKIKSDAGNWTTVVRMIAVSQPLYCYIPIALF